MLTEDIKRSLRSNQLVVGIGARGTGKSQCVAELTSGWEASGLRVLSLDASSAEHPLHLDEELAAALGCNVGALTTSELPDRDRLRIVIDRCERLYDQAWLVEWQERWRAFLLSPESQGRVAAVFLGRPLFRAIAGGDSSPLLNAGPVLTTTPLCPHQIETVFSVTPACAEAAWRKTGGHPYLTKAFLVAIDGDTERIADSIRDFTKDHRRYLVTLIEDHSDEARGVLGELLDARAEVHQSALLRTYFDGSPGRGMEAIDDLVACGLIARDDHGNCRLSADVLKNVDGLQGIVRIPRFSPPTYRPEVMEPAHRLIFDAENRLRQMIVEGLGSLDPAWWLNKVAPEVRGRAEGRRTAESILAAPGDQPLHPIAFLNLGQLFELIYQHWNQVFSPGFGITQTSLREHASRLEAGRNRLAHARMLSVDQYQDLLSTCRRLGLAPA